MSDAIKAALLRITGLTLTLQRETGKLIDPPDFDRCFEAIYNLECDVQTILEELTSWEAEESE